jgi:hypothetical protein
MQPLRVHIDGPHYAVALHALWGAERCWHELDAEMVKARQLAPADPGLEELWRLLVVMDQHIAQAVAMLTLANPDKGAFEHSLSSSELVTGR